jgi:hypothetical protein
VPTERFKTVVKEITSIMYTTNYDTCPYSFAAEVYELSAALDIDCGRFPNSSTANDLPTRFLV